MNNGWAAVALATAGVCFLLYPAIRPFADEDSLAEAKAFASAAWVIAHMLAVVAFILFLLGWLGSLSGSRRGSPDHP